MDELVRSIGPPPTSFNYNRGQSRYQNLANLSPNHPFLIPPPGAPAHTVGLEACEALAGPGYGTYGLGNALDAIGTWVIPLLILVGNINYASFQRQAYWNQLMVALGLLGNPIHAMWALLTKLDVKRRIEARVRVKLKKHNERNVWIYSTILYTLDDFNFSEKFDEHFDILMKVATDPAEWEAAEACHQAAVQLKVSRVNNTRRALLAVLGYLAAITANILRSVFADKISLHISHTIALREVNFWLLCAILLSARVGGLPSEWNSVGVMMDLQSRLNETQGSDVHFGLNRLEPWAGGNYTWRPIKDVSVKLSQTKDSRHRILAFLCFLSVTAAMAMSVVISYNTPTKGFGVRNIVEISFWAWWCVNAIVTHYFDKYYLQQDGSSSHKFSYWIISSAKDAFIAVFMLSLLFSAWSGWWNSCYHWSMAIYAGTGRTKAYIDLVNMDTEIKTLIKTLLPGLVGAGVGVQLLFAVGMIWYSQGTLSPPSMQEEEPERLYMGLLTQNLTQNLHKGPPRISTLDFVTDLRMAENGIGGGARPLGIVAGHEGQGIPLLTLQQQTRRRNTEKGVVKGQNGKGKGVL